MSEAPIPFDATSEAPQNPVLKGVWNERIKIPTPALPKEMPVGSGSSVYYTPVAEYDIEIQRDEEIVTGYVKVSADTRLPADPYRVLNQAGYPPTVILQPDGETSFKVKIVQDEYRGKAQTVATEAPLVVSITTERAWHPKSGSHNIAHFAKYKDHVFIGKKDSRGDRLSTEYDDWEESGLGYSARGCKVYLPFREDVFDNLEIIIGDTLPTI